MNNNCEYASGGHCMCSTCQAVRKAIEDAEKISKEEIDKLFCEAKEMIKEYGGDNGQIGL